MRRNIETIIPSNLELPLYKREISEDLIAKLHESHAVLGVMLGGSLAYKMEHEKADIDLFCLINNEKEFEKNIENFLRNVSNLDIIISQGYFPWTKNLYTLYFINDLSFSIDLCLIDSSFVNSFFWEPKGIILFDKEGLINKHRYIQQSDPSYTAQPFLKENPFSLSIVALKKIEKNLSRNHLFNALEQMNILRRYIMQIIRVNVLHDTNFLGRVDRDIEDCLPENLRLALARTIATYCHADIAIKTIQLTEILKTYLKYVEDTREQKMENWILKQIKHEQKSLSNYAIAKID